MSLDLQGLADDAEALDELERGDLVALVYRLGRAEEATHALLVSIDGRLGAIESKVAEYEPLIEMVRQRADRGSMWRKNRGGADGG